MDAGTINIYVELFAYTYCTHHTFCPYINSVVDVDSLYYCVVGAPRSEASRVPNFDDICMIGSGFQREEITTREVDVFDSSLRIKLGSRYVLSGLVEHDQEQYLSTWFIPYFYSLLNSDDVYHVVKSNEENRLDLISYRYYGTSKYWWVIALVNELYDPFFDVKAGKMIRVPSMDFIYKRFM